MTFLSEVARHLLTHHADKLGECTVVFPNRRTGLFLKKVLSQQISKPMWSPEIYSLEDFLLSFSNLNKADPLTLIFELYEASKQASGQPESFESFYFWGEMLLKDFEEVDHYLVNPQQLFTYVKDDKQLGEEFYFLDPQQEALIKKFWKDFFPTSTKTQNQFAETWKTLWPLYQALKDRLEDQQIGYTSHIYRSVLDALSSITFDANKPLIFAGFNALTPVEEQLIKHFITQYGAEILWDIDPYYLDDPHQEAGTFIRRYKDDTVLGRSFEDSISPRITQPKSITCTGVSLEIGQAKLLGQEISQLLAKGARREDIVVVLPQEHMLFPVLNVIPDAVDALNVTMGYPLKDTPLYGLLESAIELQESTHLSPENGLSFYFKTALDILNHPYLYQKERKPTEDLVRSMRKKNKIRIFQKEILALQSTLLNGIFRQVQTADDICTYLSEVLSALSHHVIERFGLEKEYLFHFNVMLSRLDEILRKQPGGIDLKTFKSLFSKAARSVKIPFSGDPVEGLQIMGVLETRNLDFKHVFMLNMNEDIFPAADRSGSFIPYRIRKAFDLPTFETQNAIYAYLFYRLLHAPEQVSYYYNMYADFGLSGEVSRFIRQLELESGLHVKHRKLSNTTQISESQPILVETTQEVLKKLDMYTPEVSPSQQKCLSASALNTYLTCKLQFYFKYVLRLFSNNEISEDLDARLFGNVLHYSMEFLYKTVMKEKGSRLIHDTDFVHLEASVDGAINKGFREVFGQEDKKSFTYQGRNVVMRNLIRKFVLKVLEMDKAYAPFEMVSMEKEDKYECYLSVSTALGEKRVRLSAEIDRVDKKGDTVRVLDYKTGRDVKEVNSVSALFVETKKSDSGGRKAGFQTFFYALLYANKYGREGTIVPGLINIRDLFTENFDYRIRLNKDPLTNAAYYLPEFENHLKDLLKEIWDLDTPFSQTEDLDNCKYCDFNKICNRQS